MGSLHYNYQIAVIFAILIGGCIVLGGTIAAIYFVCVNNMREDKKKLTSRSSPAPWADSSVAYRSAEPMPTSSQYAPTPSLQPMQQTAYAPQQYNGLQQYDNGYARSAIPSPASVQQQPQPLLAPQSYDMYQPQQYNDMRAPSISQQQSRSFNQSSV